MKDEGRRKEGRKDGGRNEGRRKEGRTKEEGRKEGRKDEGRKGTSFFPSPLLFLHLLPKGKAVMVDPFCGSGTFLIEGKRGGGTELALIY
jgi:hypothetical protein